MSDITDALEEIARLQAEVERLRSQPCPYVTGNVTKYCTLTPMTLTDLEREAVERAMNTLNAIEDVSPTATACGSSAKCLKAA